MNTPTSTPEQAAAIRVEDSAAKPQAARPAWRTPEFYVERIAPVTESKSFGSQATTYQS